MAVKETFHSAWRGKIIAIWNTNVNVLKSQNPAPMSFMKSIICALTFVLAGTLAQADITVGSWSPIYKGIEFATGQAVVGGTETHPQQVYAMRVDLLDPDVRLFTTPRNTNGPPETYGENTSLFLKHYGLQVAVNANFYDPCCSSPPGTPMQVIGLAISDGVVVSAQESLNDSGQILFTKAKVGKIVSNNYPPQGTNGIWTAVAGHYVVLANGVNLGFSTPEANTPNPRTALGLTQDKRYLIMMTIDGRTGVASPGAVDSETAAWLIRFGAYDGLNVDGGGSTTMVKADCDGSAIQLNVPIDAGNPGQERVIGNNFGVYAKPLPDFNSNIVVTPYDTTATITWTTPTPAAVQFQYGTTPSYGTTLSYPAELKNHVVTMNGLRPNSRYYFQISSLAGGNAFNYPCRVQTINFANAVQTPIFNVTKAWKYTTNNLDGINWQAKLYDDATWAGPGPGLLYVEDRATVTPRNTPLPASNGTNGIPVVGGIAPTYYFRTHFTFNGPPSGVTLNFSSYLDDCAVFYLNGGEIQRVRMTAAPAAITYTSISDPPNIGPCPGNNNEAVCADVFAVTPSNLLSGDNVLAVELHQAATVSNDAVFGTALSYSIPTAPKPRLNVIREGAITTIYWNGGGFTLQQAQFPGGPWSDVPGPVTSSTFVLTDPLDSDFTFFALRQ
jgi:hypothetical protein